MPVNQIVWLFVTCVKSALYISGQMPNKQSDLQTEIQCVADVDKQKIKSDSIVQGLLLVIGIYYIFKVYDFGRRAHET